jgi:ParB family chromosome partitioning protein
VTMSAQKGQIVIDFATLGDLTRIAQEMGVPDADAS